MVNGTDFGELRDDLLKNELSSRGIVKVIFESCIFLLLTVVGFVGNGCVCVAVYRNRRLRRKVTNILVVGLALSDVLMCALGAPLVIAVLMRGQWIFSKGVCKFHAILLYGLVPVSLYHMALIGVNRYFCVAKPTKYGSIFNTKSTVIFVLMIWIVAFGTMLVLYLMDWLRFYFHPFKATCVLYLEDRDQTVLYLKNLLGGIVLLAVPLTVLLMTYSSIFNHLRRHRKLVAVNQQTPEIRPPNVSRRAAELKMTKTMFAIVAGFLLCWLPIIIIDVVTNAKPPRNTWRSIKRYVALLCTFLGLLSSVANPWIIYIMDKRFRTEIRAILRCE